MKSAGKVSNLTEINHIHNPATQMIPPAIGQDTDSEPEDADHYVPPSEHRETHPPQQRENQLWRWIINGMLELARRHREAERAQLID